MDEKLRISEKRKEQLLTRVKECLDKEALNMCDWVKIYNIMLEACERERIDAMESLLMESIKEGEDT